MDKITVVCHKDHDKGYEDYVGKCLLCEVERLQKREWVGLTDDEIVGMMCECVDNGTFNADCARDYANWIEAKLKERNHGLL